MERVSCGRLGQLIVPGGETSLLDPRAPRNRPLGCSTLPSSWESRRSTSAERTPSWPKTRVRGGEARPYGNLSSDTLIESLIHERFSGVWYNASCAHSTDQETFP